MHLTSHITHSNGYAPYIAYYRSNGVDQLFRKLKPKPKLNPPNAHRSQIKICENRQTQNVQFPFMPNAFECFVTQVQTRLPKTKCVWPMKINVICTVWANYSKASFSKLRVAYNNVYRHLLGYKKRDSASMMLVGNGVDSFTTIIRKYVYRFMNRVVSSSNAIVKCLSDNYTVKSSTMWMTWNRILYVC